MAVKIVTGQFFFIQTFKNKRHDYFFSEIKNKQTDKQEIKKIWGINLSKFYYEDSSSGIKLK